MEKKANVMKLSAVSFRHCLIVSKHDSTFISNELGALSHEFQFAWVNRVFLKLKCFSSYSLFPSPLFVEN